MAKNDDEDYWNSSDLHQKPFSFAEEEEVGNPFGVPRLGTAKLSQQLKEWETGSSDEIGAGKLVTDPVLPLQQLITEDNLKLILDSHGPKSSDSTFTSSRDIVDKSVSPESLVEKLVLCLPANLDSCHSLSSKSKLLSCAIKSGDGEAILAVTQFVLRTLSKKISYNLLREHNSAFNHYANYLSSRGEFGELCNLLEALGQSKAAAIINYKMACQQKIPSQKQVQTLNTIAKSHFHNDKDEKIINQHIKLLEFQIQNHLDVGLTAQQTIIQAANKNSTEVLRNFATSLGVSERIFQWTCLRAKANIQAWGEIQAIFQTKSWLGGQKFKPLIPMSKVAIELQKSNAPMSEVFRYVKLVDDVFERQKLEASLAALSAS